MKSDLKGKRIAIIGPIGHVGIGREWAALMLPSSSFVVHAVNRMNELEEQIAKARESRLVMKIRAYSPEPMPDTRIDKTKDRFSFADKFVGRGRGSAKNQNFSQHFKK